MILRINLFFFFYFALKGVYVVYLPQILLSLNYTSFQIGIIFSLGALMHFVLPFMFLRLVPLSNKIFFLSLFGIFLSLILFYFTINNFYLFLIPNLILGACMGLILPYIENYSIKLLNKEKYGNARLFGSIGFMVSSLVLAYFLDKPINALHFLLGIGIILIYLSILVIIKNKAFNPEIRKNLKIIKFKPYLWFWINIFLVQVSFGAFYNFYTIYNIEHGISLKNISYLWAFGIICEIIIFYFQGKFLKNFNFLGLIRFTTLITAIRWLLIFLFPSSLMFNFFAQGLHAFSFALYHTAAFYYVQSVYEDKKLVTQFYYGISIGLGAFTGAILSGLLYGKYIFLFSSLVAFLAFFITKK